MAPMVTMVVPGATISPTLAAFTSTTPSIGDDATVSASCESIMAIWARARSISALRSSPLHSSGSPVHLGARGLDLFLSRTLLQHRQPLLRLPQRRRGRLGMG